MNTENHSQTAAFLWSIADLLRGDFKQSQYGRIILPFTLLRRMECVLEPTKEGVISESFECCQWPLTGRWVCAAGLHSIEWLGITWHLLGWMLRSEARSHPIRSIGTTLHRGPK